MKYFPIVLSVVIFFAGIAYAGWEGIYGGPGATEEAWGVKQRTDGGYIVVGTRDSMSGPFESTTDIYAVRLDGSGELVWSQILGGASIDKAYSVSLAHDSGYVIAGGTYSAGAGNEDVYLVKISETGEIIWSRTFGGPDYDEGLSVAPTSDGGYIICGFYGKYMDILGLVGGDIYLVKVNAEGEEVWSRTYGLPGTAREEAWEVTETGEGDFVLTGASQYGDALVLKTNSEGDSLWARTYGGTFTDFGYSVIQGSDGNFVVAGYYGTREEMWVWYHDIWVLKLDGDGDTLWCTQFNIDIDSDNYGYSIVETPGGGYAVTGLVNKFGEAGRDMALLKLNSAGEVQWNRVYGTSSTDEGHSLANTSDGGFVIAGKTAIASTDFYVVKTDSLGNIETANAPPDFTNCPGDTSIEYGDTLMVHFAAIDRETDLLTYTLDAPAGAFIEGDSVVVWIPSAPDSFPVPFNIIVCDYEYCDTCSFEVTVMTGIDESPIIIDKIEISCYPNPYSTAVTVEFRSFGSLDYPSIQNVHLSPNVTIEVYDINGRMVSSMTVRDACPYMSDVEATYIQSSGHPTIQAAFSWAPAPAIPSGIYFIKAQVGTKAAVKKVIYLK
ncbi:hypothetical protein JXI42_01700 [bacterium]|nr:hypothetical protein [bacterium]